MSKIYVAATYEMRDAAIDVMQTLIVKGHVVTSRWLLVNDSMCDEWARKDLEDVASADVLLALNPAEWATGGKGGRHVELGYAIALGKRIVLIGVRSNIFHYLDRITVIDTLDEALARITEWQLDAMISKQR